MSVSRMLLVLLLAFASQSVFAVQEMGEDEGCDGEGGDVYLRSEAGKRTVARDKAKIAQAEQFERSGNARAAYDTLLKLSSCSKYDKRLNAMENRLANKVGQEEENKGRFKEAFDWFRKGQLVDGEIKSYDNADRAIVKLVQSKPDDIASFRIAFEYVERHNAAALKTLRTLAAKNARQILAAEDKQFIEASRISSGTLDMLRKAKDWLQYVEAPDNRLAMERAEKRGDTLATETTKHFLSQAIYYYEFADKQEKAKLVRGKAKKLGDEAKGKGEGEVAVEFYQLAGLNEQADDLRKSTKTKRQADEGNRKQKFKKDQDGLEKELGM